MRNEGIQVVERALRVLEALNQRPDVPLTSGVLAEAVGLNAATCSRILKVLLEQGYVEQQVARGGYTLGPMAYALGAGGAYRADLVKAAEPLMITEAGQLRETLVLATVRRGRWLDLCTVSGKQDVQVRPEAVIGSSTPYDKATGRLCLALLPEAELEAALARHGLPSADVWPGVQTRPDLSGMLEAIRRDGHVRRDTDSLVALAVPVLQDDRPVAGLGIYLPRFRCPADPEQLLVPLRNLASRISARLDGQGSGKRIERAVAAGAGREL